MLSKVAEWSLLALLVLIALLVSPSESWCFPKCGHHAYCNRTDRVCKCESGYELSYNDLDCFRPIGARCQKQTQCSPNADCFCATRRHTSSSNSTQFSVNSNTQLCNSLTCNCNQGYVASSNGVDCEPKSTDPFRQTLLWSGVTLMFLFLLLLFGNMFFRQRQTCNQVMRRRRRRRRRRRQRNPTNLVQSLGSQPSQNLPWNTNYPNLPHSLDALDLYYFKPPPPPYSEVDPLRHLTVEPNPTTQSTSHL